MQTEIDAFSASVIVPVYNMKNYPGRCVDSILARSFDELQTFLADDGSADGSALLFCRICEGEG